MNAPDGSLFRIGELARRVGVSDSTLRSWERRYGLLEPQRSGGNYRLYSPADEQRVRRVLQLVDGGMSMAEAARAAVTEPDPTGAAGADPADLRERLVEASAAMDERAAGQILDRVFAGMSIESGLRDVVLPTLHELGDRWEDGSIGVEQEHFASNLLIERLHALASGWRPDGGPRALLACVPQEEHAIGLACLGAGLRGRGWTVTNLGANTPLDALERAAERIDPKVVVLSVALPDRLESMPRAPRLPKAARLAIGGAGADEGSAARLGAELLDSDPLDAAARLAADLR